MGEESMDHKEPSFPAGYCWPTECTGSVNIVIEGNTYYPAPDDAALQDPTSKESLQVQKEREG